MGQRINVSIVIRNNIVREGLHSLLESGYAVNSVRVPEDLLAPKGPAAHIVVLSEVFVAAGDYSILANIICDFPQAKVVVIGHNFDLQHLAEIINAGAVGYISSETSYRALRSQLELVLMGEKVFPADLIDRIGSVTPSNASADSSPELTDREREVLTGLASGLANKEIARAAGISESTVKLATKTLFRKMRVKNRTHAALVARENSWTLTGQVRSSLPAAQANTAHSMWWPKQ